MQRKKSKFWLFIFSFIPGAGEMYMGFMKMGLSLMLEFMILATIVGCTNLGALSVFPVALYIYSFFHANNLASLDDVTFHNIEDQYLFGLDGIENMRMKLEGRNRKIAALILIVLGVIMLWQVVFNVLCDIFGWDNRFLSTVYYFVRDELPRAIIGIAVIWAGLALIRGKGIGIEEDSDFDRQTGYRDHSTYGEPYASNSQSDYREPFEGNDGRFYGEGPASNGQQFYREGPMGNGPQFTGEDPMGNGPQFIGEGPVRNGQPVYGEDPVGNGRRFDGEGTAENGQPFYRDNGMADKQRPASEMRTGGSENIIYAGGPVADVQDADYPDGMNG